MALLFNYWRLLSIIGIFGSIIILDFVQSLDKLLWFDHSRALGKEIALDQRVNKQLVHRIAGTKLALNELEWIQWLRVSPWFTDVLNMVLFRFLFLANKLRFSSEIQNVLVHSSMSLVPCCKINYSQVISGIWKIKFLFYLGIYLSKNMSKLVASSSRNGALIFKAESSLFWETCIFLSLFRPSLSLLRINYSLQRHHLSRSSV